MSTLRRLFATEGRAVTVAGNTPFLLDDPERVWWIEAGRIEVFSVTVQRGQPEGARHHFLSAEVEDVLFGIDLEAYGRGQGLLAVGVSGTVIRQLPRARLSGVAAPETAAAVDRWVQALSRGAVRTIVPRPRAEVVLDPGSAAAVADGQLVQARKGVAWVTPPAGGALFLGMEPIPAETGGAFPLSAEAWMQVMGDGDLIVRGGDEVLRDGATWTGLDALYRVLFTCEFFNLRLAAVDELNRLREKAAHDAHAREASLGALASALSPESLAPQPVAPGQDPLLAACQLVGERIGVVMKAGLRREGDPEPADPLADIAQRSRVGLRRILLKDEWWTQDGGPLLGRLEAEKRPVALLPHGPRRYRLYDPSTGESNEVTAEVAARLAPFGHTFYRPLPERSLRARDFLSFALAACRGERTAPVLTGLAIGLLALVPAYFTAVLLDDVIPDASRAGVAQVAAALVLMGVCGAALELVRAVGVLRIQMKMNAVLQPALWQRLLDLPLSFYRRFTAGDLARRVEGVDQMREILSGTTLTGILTGLFSVLTFGLLFYYDAKLAWAAAGLAVLALAVTVSCSYVKLGRQRAATEIEGHISGLVLQLLSGISKLRVAGAEDRAFAEWARLFARQKRMAFRGGVVDNVMAVFAAAFPIVASMVLFAMMVMAADKPEVAGAAPAKPLSTGQFVAFNAAFAGFLTSMLGLGTALLTALAVIPLYERARPIVEAIPEVDTEKTDPGQLDGQVQVDNVTFRYGPDGPLVLDDVSLSIQPGEFVAVVGPSGSGKSTLARLLLGLERPVTGAVYYDGRDLASLDVRKLRQKIGVVMQAGRIRAGSILTNIVGTLPLGVEEAWAAARLAGIEDDIREMPMQMQTVLQQGGGALSGGQRQRLLIARAIVNRPRILLFDEATSALDNRTQAVVTDSLERLQATRIAIAHRLSTIMGADRIYVLEAGRVVQEGTYAELSEQPGLFAELIRRQVM